MDSVERYRQIIRDYILEYAAVPNSNTEIRSVPVFDFENDRYLWIEVGRENNRFINEIVVNVEIINNKIWIHFDGTEEGIGNRLLIAGLPKDKLVLGFLSPEMRKHSDFADA